MLFIFCYCPGIAQHYWQQQVNHTIQVSLNDRDNQLDGFSSIEYINRSPDTLYYIWFHLWPNAYKNDRTAFSEQLLQNGNTAFYFTQEKNHGFINRLNFSTDDIPLQTIDHPIYQDVVKLVLPHPLPPKQKITINTPFHVQLPLNFSRGGYIGKSYQITQWFPKPAVYDRYGWHPMPYLDQGEFYSEFGNYNVHITVPELYEVAATGNLVSEEVQEGQKTFIFKQNNVHDFAWFADTAWQKQEKDIRIDNRTVHLKVCYNAAHASWWKYSLDALERSVLTSSEWIGAYPYDVVTVIEKPFRNDGGMEYPTITLVAGSSDTSELHYIIRHEVGHNWFYGILASNERMHPWMDEGMNSYYDNRFRNNKPEQKPKGLFKKFNLSNFEPNALSTIYSVHADQPIETPADKFTDYNTALIPYEKAAQWMELLERKMGSEQFDDLMKAYFQKWKFRHPYPEDFKFMADSVSNSSLDDVFALLNKTGPLEPYGKRKTSLNFLTGIDDKPANNINFFPAAGYNMYDKLMGGIIIHNYSLPLPNFRFLFVPMYATNSKTFTGTASISYTHYNNKGGNWKLFINAGRFSIDKFPDDENNMRYLYVEKIVPGFRYTFNKTYPRSTTRRYIQFKHFNLNETGLSFTLDTGAGTYKVTYPQNRSYINQLTLGIENSRKLYPYQLIAGAEQGAGFIKAQTTAKYYLNYAKGGGLNVRIFAGKFFYLDANTTAEKFKESRYYLNMTGPNGYEDYTYSNYFYGRNEFEGTATQQIMERDGFFKVRTDLLSNKIGRSDKWLAALNLSTTIPNQFNPLSLLPIKIPVRLFADIGTHAEAWEKDNTTGRFLYDAGIELPLFGFARIYIPVIYSKVFKDYIKSTIPEKQFWKTISFSIDFQHLTLRKFMPQLSF